MNQISGQFNAACSGVRKFRGNLMQANDLARKHFDAAMAEVKALRLDSDAVARALLGLVVSQYLKARSVKDVRSELAFLAENCDPETDYLFMRP